MKLLGQMEQYGKCMRNTFSANILSYIHEKVFFPLTLALKKKKAIFPTEFLKSEARG